MRPTPVDTDSRWWNKFLVQRFYDLLVVHGTYRVLWNCPWRHVSALYEGAVEDGMKVVEIGPGTGRHLARLKELRDLELHLLDRFEGPLTASQARLARHRPTTHQADALKKLPLDDDFFDLAITSMVVHCIPGESLADKENLFAEKARIVRPGGRVIGATVLSDGVPHTRLGRAGLRFLNNKRVFHNTGDTLTDLRGILNTHYDDIELTVRGSVALWQGTVR